MSLNEKIALDILEILYANRPETMFESGEVSRQGLLNGLYYSESEIDKAVTNLHLRGLAKQIVNIFSNAPWISVTITKNGIDYYLSIQNEDIDTRKNIGYNPVSTSRKKKVFLSHRGKMEAYGKKLYNMLKEYNQGQTFEPYQYAIDLNPGLWLRQLEDALKKTDCFVPLLTKDYFEGPISEIEYFDALRRYFNGKSLAIVPIIIDIPIDEFQNTFLGGFTFKKFPINTEGSDFIKSFIDFLEFLKKPSG
jgi:hypothetical protein